MTEPEELDEDFFADLYEGDDNTAKPAESAPEPIKTEQEAPEPVPAQVPSANGATTDVKAEESTAMQDVKHENNDQAWNNSANGNSGPAYDNGQVHSYVDDDDYRPVGIKEDGKMFIGGLNWETSDQSMKEYFSQFGEVLECTVMRDGASGRSRGFGFLTFKDPKTVNIVMVKEHYLDGKIIDPKRAIPRDEQERTSKIFVGGVSQEATEQDFKSFFMNFGRVLDATLMMDKDTGRPRGFGFVTFDSEAAVDRTLEGPLQILGKQIEVKKAQPRGNLRDNEDDGGRGKFNRFGNQKNDKVGHNDRQNGNSDNQKNQNQQDGSMGATNGMSPAMMAQYWQRMQQYFAMMQQQMAASIATQGQGMTNPMMGGQMNPAMMQQMMAMQQQQQQQNMGGRGPAMSPGSTPGPQSPGSQGMPAMAGMQSNMNLAMVQQMQAQQMMAQQAAAAQAQAHAQGGYAGMNNANANPNAGGGGGGGMISPMPGVNRPAYNAQEQLAFEQQKYERQQAQRLQHPHQQAYGSYGPGAGPTSWEGMYDDVAPPPAMVGAARGGAGGMQGAAGFGGRQMSPAGRGGLQQNSNRASQPAGAAPANAPTGPKNAGVRGANYRGGGRGAHRGGFHPYQRGGQ